MADRGVVGTPYQVVLRLYSLAEDYWSYLDSHYYQINLMAEPVHRFCNLTYGWAKSLIPEDKQDMFEAELNAPIPGSEDRVSDTTLEEEGELFMTAMNQLEV